MRGLCVCVCVCFWFFFPFSFFFLRENTRECACGENLQSKKLTKTAALLLKENTPTIIICAWHCSNEMSIVPVSTPLPLGVTVGERLSGTAPSQDNHFSITICCKNWWGGFSFCCGCCCLTKAWLSNVSDLLHGYQPDFRMSTCKVTANSIGDLEKRGPI